MGCVRPNFLHVPKSSRQSRRGPRSLFALKRRWNKDERSRPDMGMNCGESQSPSLSFHLHLQPLRILCCNVQSIMGKLTELSFLADLYHVDVFMIQETWLDASIQNLSLPNFHVLSRRDRSDEPNRGGVLVLGRVELKNVVF